MQIAINPGTTIGRCESGKWRYCDQDMYPVAKWGGRGFWASPRTAVSGLINERIFDVTSFPTFNEPNWRLTKFVVPQFLKWIDAGPTSSANGGIYHVKPCGDEFEYYVKKDHMWQPCDSMDHGKQLCQQHWESEAGIGKYLERVE